MKALTLLRPWPALVLHYGKDVENRVWTRNHLGPLLIHAGKGWDDDAGALAAELLGPTVAGQLLADDHPTGIVGRVTVTGAHHWRDCGGECSSWAMEDQFHWGLTAPVPFVEPILCRGFQQLWTPPDDVLDLVAEYAA